MKRFLVVILACSAIALSMCSPFDSELTGQWSLGGHGHPINFDGKVASTTVMGIARTTEYEFHKKGELYELKFDPVSILNGYQPMGYESRTFHNKRVPSALKTALFEKLDSCTYKRLEDGVLLMSHQASCPTPTRDALQGEGVKMIVTFARPTAKQALAEIGYTISDTPGKTGPVLLGNKVIITSPSLSGEFTRVRNFDKFNLPLGQPVAVQARLQKAGGVSNLDITRAL